jgi:hypothetical protein
MPRPQPTNNKRRRRIPLLGPYLLELVLLGLGLLALAAAPGAEAQALLGAERA